MEEVKLAVIGDPIAHSLSPKIHNKWLKQHNIQGKYEAINVKENELRDFLTNLAKDKFLGINITIPHKEKAYDIIKEIGEVRDIANEIKAINTIKIQDGKLIGYNTDAYGYINSIYQKVDDFSFSNKEVLIIGAGGAAKAIILALIKEGVKKIIIANRNKIRADELVKTLNISAEIIKISEIDNYLNKIDFIVNSSACGLKGENDLNINWSVSKRKLICSDIVYNPLKTKFLNDALNNNHNIVTGEGMLIYQAALAFEIWLNKEVNIDIVKKYF